MTQILIYAVKEDLLPVLELVESKGPLKYAVTGNFLAQEAQDRFKVFNSGVEIPNLGKADAESSMACAVSWSANEKRRLICSQCEESMARCSHKPTREP